MEKWIRRAALIAIIAGLGGATGDILMLAAPGFVREPATAVLTIPMWRVVVGFILGVLCIPLYIAGYWAVYERIKAAGPRLTVPVLALGTFGVVLGTTFHGLAASATYIVQNHTPAGTDPFSVGLAYGPILVPPFALLHLILIVATVYLFRAGRAIDLPNWLLWLSPGPVIFGLYIIGVAVAPIGDYLFPAAMNLAHVVFFAAVTRYFDTKD